jgi:hypothetical protein
VAKAQPGIRFNKHIEGNAPAVFAHACKLGLARFHFFAPSGPIA